MKIEPEGQPLHDRPRRPPGRDAGRKALGHVRHRSADGQLRVRRRRLDAVHHGEPQRAPCAPHDEGQRILALRYRPSPGNGFGSRAGDKFSRGRCVHRAIGVRGCRRWRLASASRLRRRIGRRRPGRLTRRLRPGRLRLRAATPIARCCGDCSPCGQRLRRSHCLRRAVAVEPLFDLVQVGIDHLIQLRRHDVVRFVRAARQSSGPALRADDRFALRLAARA